MIRCSTCNGTKKLASMGGMTRSCPNCNGIGSVEAKTIVSAPIQVDKPKIEILNATIDIEQPRIKQKRGRKPSIPQFESKL
jgi:DnaJ-class molecular chaperone